MGKKIRKITSQGQTVKGALAAYVAPRLAADGAIKPGELDALLKTISPETYAVQIPLIVDAAKSMFGSRLAKDLDLEDLPDILEALKSASEEEEEGGDDLDELGEDDDGTDEVGDDHDGVETPADEDAETPADEDAETPDEEEKEHPGVKLMKMLGNYEIPPEDLEQINELITALSKSEGGSMKETPKAKPIIPAEAKEEAITKPAMDAALRASEVSTREQFASLFAAAEFVAPMVGKIDTLAFDSADAIYKLALDAAGISTKDIHPSAYKALLKLAGERPAASVSLAEDSADVESFVTRYPNIPTQA